MFSYVGHTLNIFTEDTLQLYFPNTHSFNVLLAQAVTAFSYSLPSSYYSTTTIFSKYSPQTSQNQSLEEASNGLCEGATPQGPPTLHRAEMTPPPPPQLDYTVYTVTSIYRCDVRPYVAINISIRYGSEWVTFCCSYVFCHKMVNNGRILVFEVSIEPY